MGVLARKLMDSPGTTNIVTATFVAGTNIDGTTDTFTFTNHAIGAAHANRRVVVVAYANGSSALSISSITIGGTAADQDAYLAPGIPDGPMMIASRAVSSGTTATIVVNATGTPARCRIAVYSVVGSASIPTLKDSDTLYSADPSSSISRTVDASNGNAVVAGVGLEDINASSATVSWTGVTNDDQNSTGSTTVRLLAVGNAEITSGSSLTVTGDIGAAQHDMGIVVACYQ